jgi:hypothetical protein
VPHKKIDRLGIRSSPSNSYEPEHMQHAMELLYENPTMFKKIFQLFKAYAAEAVHALFTADRTYLYSKSPAGTEKILCEIFCERMNQYYVSEPLHIVFSTEKFYSIFQSLPKTFSSVAFATTQTAKYQKIWTIFVDDNEEESVYSLDLNTSSDDPLKEINSVLRHESDYPISFEWDFKQLKGKVSEYMNLRAKKMNIEQQIVDGRRSFYVKCETPDHQITNESPFKNTARINFISTWDEPLFTAPVYLNSVQPLAKTLISDRVKLSVDESRDLIFTADLDHEINPKNKNRVLGTEKCRVRVAIGLAKSSE